jgi:F-type H+-transporting ATPase subunit epsilon
MFILTIVNISEVLFRGEVSSVTLPGSEGELTVLPNHIPLVSPLKAGEIVVRGVDNKVFPVEKGIVEVSKSEVIVLV